jgi:histone H3/H4
MENTETTTTTTETSANEGTVLVVTSKVKKFIKEISGMNTAGDVPEALTKLIEVEINKAIAKAKDAGRKTVMARDVEAPTTAQAW